MFPLGSRFGAVTAIAGISPQKRGAGNGYLNFEDVPAA
jgi:hypothetical protein